MSKYVYVWDAQNHWSDKKVVSDDYKLQANETFDPVPDGQQQPSTRIAGGWKGATKEEHEAYLAEQRKLHPDQYPEQKPAEPSKQDQALNALGLQLSQVQKTQAAQSQAINALGLQFAQAQGKGVKEQGGNQ